MPHGSINITTSEAPNSKNALNIPIKFGKDKTDFSNVLQQRVDAYFDGRGISRKGNWVMQLKTVLVYGLLVTSYALCLSGALDQWGMLACAILFGTSLALIAFNVGHDAAHGSYSESSTVNHILSYSLNVIGVNRYIWNIKHNLSHHNFTNIPFADLDNENVAVARLTRFHQKRWIYRFQHLYLPIFWLFFSIYLAFVKDFQLFLARRVGNNTFAKHPLKEWLILIISKVYFISATIVIPLVVIDLPAWKILIGIVVMHMCTGVLLGSIFFFVHLLDDLPFPEENSEGKIDNGWFVHQLEVTSDYSPNNRLLAWLAGGLNLHVAHHLYPEICHVHYGNLTRIIRETADEFGIPYHSKSFSGAFWSHLKFLKKMAGECRPIAAYADI